MTEQQKAVLKAYREAREEGLDAWGASCYAWNEVRKQDKRLRAPSGLTAIAKNGGTVRSFRIPLAQFFGLFGYDNIGQYCGKWPRTVTSCKQEDEARERFLAWIEDKCLEVYGEYVQNH